MPTSATSGSPVAAVSGTPMRDPYLVLCQDDTWRDITVIPSARNNFLPVSVAQNFGLANVPFYVAHRGGGCVRPEHTLIAYDEAAALGASAVELSVQPLADGTWMCMHDATFDRTTNAAGNVIAKTWSDVKNNVVVDIGSQLLGPSWANQPVSRLQDVLQILAGRVLLFVEPKVTSTISSASSLLTLLLRYAPPSSYVWKTGAATPNGGIPASALVAQNTGMPVWAYLDGSEPTAFIDATAAVTNMIGVSSTATDAQIAYVVSRGKPVIAWPVTRRSRVTQLQSLGVLGTMASTAEYLWRPTTQILTASAFGSGVRQAGDLPYGDDLTMDTFDVANSAITMTGNNTAHSVCLGSMAPITATSYTITYQMRWPTVPSSTRHSDFIFGQADDYQYQHQSTSNTSGYHLVFRNDGQLQLYKHVNGSSSGTQLGTTITTTTPVNNTWMSFSIGVTPTQITFQRTDDASGPQTVTDSLYRGGYTHIAVASSDTTVHFRNIVIT